MPARRGRLAGAVRGVVGRDRHLQQGSHEHARLPFRYHSNELAFDGHFLHPPCGAASEVLRTQVDRWENGILFGMLNGTSIGLLNLSLGFNSIGFYQMTKLAIIPFTVMLETIFLKKKFSESIKLSLLVLLLGVGIASITDLKLNLLGSILSLLAIATTCVGQIMTNTIQKKLKVSSTQLLYQSSPYQAAILFVTGPFVDKCLTSRSVFAHQYSVLVLGFIVLSCLIAVSVNFSTFLVIGTTSPVTYQVLGHLKTCLVLSFGYTLLHDPFTARNILGILVAIFGMALYSYFCVKESKKKVASDALPVSQMKDMEETPLLVTKNGAHQENNDTKKANGVPLSNKDSHA
ncbi:putative membrane protein [Iris pallida]|uniref:Membrane protein n=1 Tax=Iris pallida TaxID=29817 RepID=A0AAX6GJB8_IRIPA|nr:putative membrane protein [Iris pallida]